MSEHISVNIILPGGFVGIITHRSTVEPLLTTTSDERPYGTPYVTKLKTSLRYVPGMDVTSPFGTKIRNA